MNTSNALMERLRATLDRDDAIALLRGVISSESEQERDRLDEHWRQLTPGFTPS